MKLVYWSIAALIAGALLTSAAPAQPPAPKPGPEHERLKELVGTWDATIDMGGQKSKGTMVYKMGIGGLWLISDFEGSFGDAKFEGKGLDSYDPARKKYVGVWIDSMETSPMLTEGNYDPDRKAMVMTGEGPGPDGKPMKYKMVTEMKSPDDMVFTMYGAGPSGGEQPMFTITYQRRK